MILCVALSPALDLTYRVAALRPGATNRVAQVTRRAGGKAVNVARVLQALGEPVHLLAPVGGATGDAFAAELADLDATLVASGPATRATVTVVDGSGGEPTVLVEPAALDCWDELVAATRELVTRADVVVISGVLPDGVPPDALSVLVRLADDAGCATVVDTSGPPLLEVLPAGPTVVKPNAAELTDATGDDDPVRAARTLAARSGGTVVASLGADGAVAAAADRVWTARPRTALSGNPTGAGDALVAGLARALRGGDGPADMLRDAVALGAAAVLAPHAGAVDVDEYDRQRRAVIVGELGGVR